MKGMPPFIAFSELLLRFFDTLSLQVRFSGLATRTSFSGRVALPHGQKMIEEAAYQLLLVGGKGTPAYEK